MTNDKKKTIQENACLYACSRICFVLFCLNLNYAET